VSHGTVAGAVAVGEGHAVVLTDDDGHRGVFRFFAPAATPLFQAEKQTFALTSDPAGLTGLVADGFNDFGAAGGSYPLPGDAFNLGFLFGVRNPVTNDRIYTRSSIERNGLLAQGFVNEGNVGLISAIAQPGFKPLHRLFNADTGTHRFTGNSDDLSDLPEGFVSEGVTGFVRKQMATDLRRVSFAGSDIVTLSQREASLLESVGGVDRGAIGSVFASRDDSPDLVPLFRLQKPESEDRLFTTSASERGAALAQNFKDEGVAGYVHREPGAGRVPLFRAREIATGNHRYTSDGDEFVGLGSGFVKEGIVGYMQREVSPIAF
jgi:hypothetical protein